MGRGGVKIFGALLANFFFREVFPFDQEFSNTRLQIFLTISARIVSTSLVSFCLRSILGLVVMLWLISFGMGS